MLLDADHRPPALLVADVSEWIDHGQLRAVSAVTLGAQHARPVKSTGEMQGEPTASRVPNRTGTEQGAHLEGCSQLSNTPWA